MLVFASFYSVAGVTLHMNGLLREGIEAEILFEPHKKIEANSPTAPRRHARLMINPGRCITTPVYSPDQFPNTGFNSAPCKWPPFFILSLKITFSSSTAKNTRAEAPITNMNSAKVRLSVLKTGCKKGI